MRRTFANLQRYLSRGALTKIHGAARILPLPSGGPGFGPETATVTTSEWRL